MPYQPGPTPTPTPAATWTVHDQHISLIRPSLATRSVRVSAEPAAVEIEFARTALIVVDMQNDFCHADGWFGCRGIDVTPMCKTIASIGTLVEALRAAGSHIIWLNWGIRADRANLPASVFYRGKRLADAAGYGELSSSGHGPSLVQASWGAAQIDQVPARADDVSVNKHRLSGFWDTELDSLLRAAGVTTLFFAGINTDRCVFSTLQDAGFLGYDCVLVEDACARPSPQYVTDSVLPGMIAKRSGKILNAGGTFGICGRAGRMACSASKWGPRGITKSFALEAGPYGINVNNTASGMLDGPRFRDKVCADMAKKPGISSEAAADRHAADYALKRVTNDTDVANACLFMVSDVSRQITGVDLPFDGGWAML